MSNLLPSHKITTQRQLLQERCGLKATTNVIFFFWLKKYRISEELFLTNIFLNKRRRKHANFSRYYVYGKDTAFEANLWQHITLCWGDNGAVYHNFLPS